MWFFDLGKETKKRGNTMDVTSEHFVGCRLLQFLMLPSSSSGN